MWKCDEKLIVNLASESAVCERSAIADSAPARMRGLLGRSELPAGEGILLKPAPAIHTAFMRFPIDAVFLDAELRVVKLVAHLVPWRTAGAPGARAVLELADGEIAHRELEVGQQLAIRERVVEPAVSPASWLSARSL